MPVSDSDVMFTLLVPNALPAVTLSANCTRPPLTVSAPAGKALVVGVVGSMSSVPAVTVVPRA